MIASPLLTGVTPARLPTRRRTPRRRSASPFRSRGARWPRRPGRAGARATCRLGPTRRHACQRPGRRSPAPGAPSAMARAAPCPRQVDRPEAQMMHHVRAPHAAGRARSGKPADRRRQPPDPCRGWRSWRCPRGWPRAWTTSWPARPVRQTRRRRPGFAQAPMKEPASPRPWRHGKPAAPPPAHRTVRLPPTEAVTDPASTVPAFGRPKRPPRRRSRSGRS